MTTTQLRAPAHRAAWLVWVALTVACMGVGYQRLAHDAPLLPKLATGRDATSDTWLQVLEIPHPSDALRAALATIPEGEALVFVSTPSKSPKLTWMVISMLAWPHQVGYVLCDDDGTAGHQVDPTDHVGAVLLYRVGAAYSQMAVGSTPTVRVGDRDVPSQGIGPALQLITGTETTTWPSYCSL